ncbi:MAG: CidA/LrgA family protein [Alphaproteobacteria bacterium]|nr:CidA/LrgA family protein [Alphaproteobacteria bacterium]
MIGALTLLLLCQLAGELLARLCGLPVPGPVLGLVMLFVICVARGSMPEPLRETSQTILRHLSLLFVPAGVGVMVHAARIESEWVAILVALLVSAVLTIAVTALVFRWVARWSGTGGEAP